MNAVKTIYLTIIIVLLSTFVCAQKVQKMYDKGIKQLDKGKYQKGHATLQKLLKIDSTHRNALFTEGYYAVLEGRQDVAEGYFEKLIRHHPDQPDGFIGRATISMTTEDLENAELDLIRAYALDSTSAEVHTAFGQLYSMASLFNKSNTLLDKALSIDPNYAPAYQWIGFNHWLNEENDEALAHILKCLELDPSNVEAHKIKAYILFEMGKYEEVAKTYEHLAKEIPSALFELDLYTWATAYFHGKKYEAASKVIAKISQPQFSQTYYTQARLAYKLGNTELALQKLNTAIKKGQESQDNIDQMLYDRAVLLAKNRRIDEAKKDFIEAIQGTPELIEQTNASGKKIPLLGNAKYLLGKHFSTHQLDSIRIVGWQQRALDLALNNETKEADITINKATQLQKNNSKSTAIKGVVVALSGKFEDSFDYFDRALLQPLWRDYKFIYYLKATILYQMGDFNKVIQCVNQGLGKAPNDADLHFLKAEALHELNHTEDALNAVEKALVSKPKDEEYLLEKAYYLLELKQHDKALNICNNMIDHNTLNMEATYCRALIYQMQKKYKLAKTDLEKCLRYYPEDQEVNTTYNEVLEALK